MCDNLSSELKSVRNQIEGMLPEHEHAKRKRSIAHAVMGLIESTELSLHKIGHGMAEAFHLHSKHAVKQVDRLLSNPKFDLHRLWPVWISKMLGELQEVVVAMDWTDYGKDGHCTISLALATHKGRAQPLMWKTIRKSDLKGRQHYYEDVLLTEFRQYVPNHVRVIITADRGFADQKFFSFLDKLQFEYVIRIKASTKVGRDPNEMRSASRWLKADGRIFSIKDPYITTDFAPVSRFVSVKKKDMKEPWFVVSSLQNFSGVQLIKAYARRFTIEEMFRDDKDRRFGMGLSHTRIRSIHRRDRILFLAALARDLLSSLGAAGEMIGYDKWLKVNTVKHRTLSLYRQGLLHYAAMKNWQPPRRDPLLDAWATLLLKSTDYLNIFGLLPI